ncbi:MAG: hypothetical protein ACK4M7_01615, partial [Burkholderiales bacterium]
NPAAMDPNNCTTTTLNPGSNCTFYLQISNESYAANSQQDISISLNYNIQSNFLQSTFGSGNSSSQSTNFSIQELTNLYIMQNNAMLWTMSNHNLGSKLIQAAEQINSLAMDNSSYGLLYLAGQNGIYQYGIESGSATTSISSLPLSGANNLFTISGNLYATGLAGATGVWQWSLANESWTSNSPAYGLQSVMQTNANAVSPTAVIYLSQASLSDNNSSGTNLVYACSGSTSGSQCAPEGTATPLPITAKVSSLGFLSGTASPYTGLYAGTTLGLFAESGTTPSTTNAGWVPVIGATTPIKVIKMDNEGNLYAGDTAGNIWRVTQSAPTVANAMVAALPGPVTAMLVDNVAKILYFTAGNTNILYWCQLSQPKCTPATNNTSLGISGIAGMAIGSQLTS